MEATTLSALRHCCFSIFSSRLRGVLLLASLWVGYGQAASAACPAFIDGVGTHFAQGRGQLDKALFLITGAGLKSLRDEAYWNVVEKTAGKMDVPQAIDEYVSKAAAAGLCPMMALDYGNPLYDGADKPRSPAAIAAFANYATAIATRFRSAVSIYEVWNEWDGRLGHTSRGSTADYVPVLKAASQAIKAVNPDAIVLADGVLFFDGRAAALRVTAETGALRYADGIALHPYFYNRGPNKRPEAWAAYLERAEHALQATQGGSEVKLFVTETGWPTGGWDGVSESLQASYASRLYLLAHTLSFLHGLWWYDLSDDLTNDADRFGLVHQDLSPKPALGAVRVTLEQLAGATFMDRRESADGAVVTVRFRRPDHGVMWAIWSADDKPRSARLTRGACDMCATRASDLAGNPVPLTWATHAGQRQASIAVSHAPVFLTSDGDAAMAVDFP